MHIAPRYTRKGALNLFALLSVADGLVRGCCRARKRFGDFQVFFWQCIVPEALQRGVREIRLILDNGPTHAPKRLAAWLDAECETPCVAVPRRGCLASQICLLVGSTGNLVQHPATQGAVSQSFRGSVGPGTSIAGIYRVL
jgi:hypothetical protein